MPGTHALQLDSPSYDTCPGGQVVQGELPELFLYLPTSHAVQLPAGPVYPGSQEGTQLLTSVLPGADSVDSGQAVHSCREELYVPAGHCSQSTTLLATALYVPGSQAEHMGSHGGSAQAKEVYPLLQRHMLALSEPAIDCELGAQGSKSPPE